MRFAPSERRSDWLYNSFITFARVARELNKNRTGLERDSHRSHNACTGLVQVAQHGRFTVVERFARKCRTGVEKQSHDSCTNTGGVENSMNELNVEVIPNWLCSSMWRRVGIHVLDAQVCVGYGDTGACYGDSGGPLMCEVEGRYYVTGVMSWLVSNCSAMGFPNVFTRVPSYLDWIYEKLEYYDWWRYK
ncbi:plasma kallikrein-like [Gigantopelta aegis]|uniref:plasma kallikrein-like n=1 Tax=Gigantopelta aegis TaxID=1735272 RepID=UPI001B889E5F|nr:plasma kallikrein-like [Gigantopelta aegis]